MEQAMTLPCPYKRPESAPAAIDMKDRDNYEWIPLPWRILCPNECMRTGKVWYKIGGGYACNDHYHEWST